MQNTKNKELGGKKFKGERETDENYIKIGGKGLKSASFCGININ